MNEYKIEDAIAEFFTGAMQVQLLNLIRYLKSNDMVFERGKGYWENQLYYMVKFNDEYVCFILINETRAYKG